MNGKFAARKEDIQKKLAKETENYTDASPKGSVDEGIRELVNEINSTPSFVTTSSCAGRIAVFLEGPHKQRANRIPQLDDANEESVEATSSVSASAGGKGGGKWLFTSHDAVEIDDPSNAGALFQLFGFPSDSRISFPSTEVRPQFVHIKFEPMILHILSSSPSNAQKALHAATAAGFRESGISNIVDDKSGPACPMVAVRSSGLAFDSIIGFQCPPTSSTGTSEVHPMVSESYLRTLLHVANERLDINEQRKLRFREAFLSQAFGVTTSASRPGFEPSAVRKERLRREGLLRREEMLSLAPDGAHNNNGKCIDEDDEYGLNLLVEEDEQEGQSSQKASEERKQVTLID